MKAIEVQLNDVLSKIEKLVSDYGFKNICRWTEIPAEKMPFGPQGWIHIWSRTNDMQDNILCIDTVIFTEQWWKIFIWDADTGKEISNSFIADNAIEKMLEFIKEKLPVFQFADSE